MPGADVFPMGLGGLLLPLAYVDPMAGGMLLQLLAGGVAGVLMIVKLYWQQFKSFFRRSGAAPSSGDASSPKEAEKTD